MPELSNQQKAVFDYIKGYIEEHSLSPSVREICEAVGLKSTSTVHGHISRLEKKGYIIRTKNKNRFIQLAEKYRTIPTTPIPLLGKVTAGVPIEAVENFEAIIPLPKNLFKGDQLFILNVKGVSMINAGIFNGDKIVVDKDQYINNGDIVVAMMDGEATVKRYYKERDHIRLQPENDSMQPIITTNVEILGKVVGLIRVY